MARIPLMSIITVNLNNLEGLRKTMLSVFEQTWQEFEYIIIDGGSIDGSKELVEEHNSQINFWVSEPDKGIYNGMNKGIRAATGKYLFFLNSGDWFFNNEVLQLVSRELGSCDILYGNMVKVMPDGNEILDKGIKGKEITLKTFIEGNLNHQSTFINHALFKKYGYYDEKINVVADWKFFLLALGLNNSNVKYIDIELSYFDMTGLSSNFKARDMQRKKVLQETIPFPIFKDYLKLKELESEITSPRIRKFLMVDNNKIFRKINSIIFRIFT